MHAGQGSGGPAAGGDPKQNTDCTFAKRFFSPDHGFTANKPEFFSAGAARVLCVQQGPPHPDNRRPKGQWPGQAWPWGRSASATGCGSGAVMVPGRPPGISRLAHCPGTCAAALRRAPLASVGCDSKASPAPWACLLPPESVLLYTHTCWR